jgi:hypothetical protein
MIPNRKGTPSETQSWGSGEELDETEWSEAGSDPYGGQEWSGGSAPAEGDVSPGLEMETTGTAGAGEVLAGPAWPSLQEIEGGTGPTEAGLAMEETGSVSGPAGTATPDHEDAEVAIYEDEIRAQIQGAVDNLSGPDPDPIEAVRKLRLAAVWLEGLGQVYLHRDPEKYNAIMSLRAGALSLRDAVSPAALTMRTAGDLGSLAGGLLDEAAALGSRLR